MSQRTFGSLIWPPPLQLTSFVNVRGFDSEAKNQYLLIVVSVDVSVAFLSKPPSPLIAPDKAGVPSSASNAPLIVVILDLSFTLTDISALSSPPSSHPDINES